MRPCYLLGGEPSHAFYQAGRHLAPDRASTLETWCGRYYGAAAQVGVDPARPRAGSQVEAEIPGCWNCNWWTRRRAGSGWTTLAQRDFALCVQSALERLGLGPVLPIDAHSAAVAAVPPCGTGHVATRAAGTPVKYCVVPTAGRATRASSTASRTRIAPVAPTASSPKLQPDQQRKVGNQQRRMHMQPLGGDFDFRRGTVRLG